MTLKDIKVYKTNDEVRIKYFITDVDFKIIYGRISKVFDKALAVECPDIKMIYFDDIIEIERKNYAKSNRR